MSVLERISDIKSSVLWVIQGSLGENWSFGIKGRSDLRSSLSTRDCSSNAKSLPVLLIEACLWWIQGARARAMKSI